MIENNQTSPEKPCGHNEFDVPGCSVCRIVSRRGRPRTPRREYAVNCDQNQCSVPLQNFAEETDPGSDIDNFKPVELSPLGAISRPVEDYLNRIEQLNNDLPSDWVTKPEVVSAYRIKFRQLCAAQYEPMPSHMEGKGIVTCVGGSKYFACAWAQIGTLRKLGCNLPVEVWYMGKGEMDDNMKSVMSSLANVYFVDALEIVASLPKKPRILNGWELKPFSIIHSRFEEVLFLDADCIPLINPEHLFDSAEYKSTGSIFWPDIPPHDRKEWLPAVVWENCGMAYRDEVDFESGQMLINKKECWKPLQVTMWINEHSDYYYKFVFGDKSTYHLAWRGCGMNYGIPRACDWKHPALLQYDMRGRLCFLHCCRGKELLYNATKINSLPESARLQNICRSLKNVWDGKIYDFYDQTYREFKLAEAVAGFYKYRRLHNNERFRDMQLLPNGEISKGSGKCEKRWTLRLINNVPTLVIVGEGHKGTELGMMFLTQDNDGVWRGKWEAHERCPVELVANVPELDEFSYNPRQVAESRQIAHENLYNLPAGFNPADTIVDLDADLGVFALTAAYKHPKRVICYEEDISKYLVLKKLLKPFGTKINMLQLPENNLPMFSLDHILDDLGEREIRILKLKLADKIWEQLEKSSKLQLAREIKAKYSDSVDTIESSLKRVDEKLKTEGFAVSFTKPALDGTGKAYGYLEAKRF